MKLRFKLSLMLMVFLLFLGSVKTQDTDNYDCLTESKESACSGKGTCTEFSYCVCEPRFGGAKCDIGSLNRP